MAQVEMCSESLWESFIDLFGFRQIHLGWHACKGRSFDGTYKGKYGPIEKFGGMLMETIHFPDSPNQPRFPSTVLRPGQKYHSVTEFRFYSK